MGLRRRLLQNQKFYLIVNITPSQKPSSAKLESILRSGIDIVQLRCKDVSDRVFLEYALKLRRLCRINNLVFIINDRVDLVLVSGADGVHLGQGDIPPSAARRILGHKKIIGLSTHNLTQIRKAKISKEIDYIGVGPVFRTEAKAGQRPLGLSLIRKISKDKRSLPFFAIGGITVSKLRPLIQAGADRIAVCGSVFNSKDPVKTAGEFRKILYDPD